MSEATARNLDDPSLIVVNGETLTPLPAGAAYWPSQDALIVSDLHLEKGSSFARRGVMLPPYDTRTTLRRLRAICRDLNPSKIISLGDAFHDVDAETRMDSADVTALQALIGTCEWIWITGNHDPEPPARFAGKVRPALRMGGLFFTHEPSQSPEPGEVAGHLHPCARVKTGTKILRRRCFVGNGDRLILPAFGAFTGGLNVLDAAYSGLFAAEFTAWVMGGEGVYPISPASLAPEAVSLRRRSAG